MLNKVVMKQILSSIIILIILSFVCMYIYDHYKVESVTSLVISKQDNCIGNLKQYYQDNDSNYYLYCLDKIDVDFGDRILDLSKALELKQIDMDFVFNNTDKKDSYWDGGSTIYQGDNFSVLKCDTLDGNHDYYFGPVNMKYEEGFCKKDPYIKSFSKYYDVVAVNDGNDLKYTYITLKEFGQNEVVTVKLEKTVVGNILEQCTYEFVFGTKDLDKIDDINTIFDSNIILSVNERIID